MITARRTRSSSARDTKPITDPPKPTPRKTKKKTIVVEVEVSDEEDETVNEPTEGPIINDPDVEDKKVDINKNDKDEEVNNVDETNGKIEEVEPDNEETEIKFEEVKPENEETEVEINEVALEGKIETDEVAIEEKMETDEIAIENTKVENEVIEEEKINESGKEIEDENIESLENEIKMDTNADVQEIVDEDLSEKEVCLNIYKKKKHMFKGFPMMIKTLKIIFYKIVNCNPEYLWRIQQGPSEEFYVPKYFEGGGMDFTLMLTDIA